MADLIIGMGIFGGFVLLLGVGGCLVDHVFHLIPALEQWIKALEERQKITRRKL